MFTTKSQLISVLILAVICVSATAAEPNESEAASKFIVVEEPNQFKAELIFEISTEEREFKTEEHMFFEGFSKPKYVAIFSMSDLSKLSKQFSIGGMSPQTCAAMLATSAGKSMSELQKNSLREGRVISTISVRKRFTQYSLAKYTGKVIDFGLYAFTLEDAKLVTEAFIETMCKEAREELPPLLEKFMNERRQKLQEYRESIADIKKKLAEKEPELKSAESAYRKFKNTDCYKIFADTDADEKTRKTIAQMNEMLSIIDIELAGIREKLNVIEKYRRESDKFSKATLDKLEQMFVEQMVELKGAEGRKEAAVKLRNQDVQFCDLYDAWTGLYIEVQNLRIRINDDERKVRFIEEEMASPPDELLPPKVFQNKVTIYPVLAEE